MQTAPGWARATRASSGTFRAYGAGTGARWVTLEEGSVGGSGRCGGSPPTAGSAAWALRAGAGRPCVLHGPQPGLHPPGARSTTRAPTQADCDNPVSPASPQHRPWVRTALPVGGLEQSHVAGGAV